MTSLSLFNLGPVPSYFEPSGCNITTHNNLSNKNRKKVENDTGQKVFDPLKDQAAFRSIWNRFRQNRTKYLNLLKIKDNVNTAVKVKGKIDAFIKNKILDEDFRKYVDRKTNSINTRGQELIDEQIGIYLGFLTEFMLKANAQTILKYVQELHMVNDITESDNTKKIINYTKEYIEKAPKKPEKLPFDDWNDFFEEIAEIKMYKCENK